MTNGEAMQHLGLGTAISNFDVVSSHKSPQTQTNQQHTLQHHQGLNEIINALHASTIRELTPFYSGGLPLGSLFLSAFIFDDIALSSSSSQQTRNNQQHTLQRHQGLNEIINALHASTIRELTSFYSGGLPLGSLFLSALIFVDIALSSSSHTSSVNNLQLHLGSIGFMDVFHASTIRELTSIYSGGLPLVLFMTLVVSVNFQPSPSLLVLDQDCIWLSEASDMPSNCE
jgi:hypothetical protein